MARSTYGCGCTKPTARQQRKVRPKPKRKVKRKR